MSTGRIAKIDQYPDLKERLAEALVDGASYSALADKNGPWYEVFGVSDRATISSWAKREEIQARVATLHRDRANRVMSKTDTKILAALDSNEDIPVETLLKIRQTFAGTTVNVNKGDPAEALQEMLLAAHNDPELARAVGTLQGRKDDDGEATPD